MNDREYSGMPTVFPHAKARTRIAMALIPCFIGTILLGLASNGVHHDDDLAHYLMARWSRWFPGYLLHVWGRPGATIPMAAVAWIGNTDVGWHACRALSACVTALTAWLAATLAMRKGIGPAWLIVLLCYVQPLNALLAATTLTENYLALYLMAAVVLLDRRRPMLASAIFSLSLLTRHETLVLLPVWWAGLIWRGECRIANDETGAAIRESKVAHGSLSQFAIRHSPFLISLWAPIAHNCLHYAAFGKWPFRMFLTPKGSTEYLATSTLGYLPAALQAIPPAIFALAIIGGVLLVRRRDWLIPALAGTFLATHFAVTAFGVFASGGYARFMVGIAPFVAILAVTGVQWLRSHWNDQRRVAVFWLLLAATWLTGFIALDIERRAGRLSIAQPAIINAIRLSTIAIVAISIAQVVPLARGSMWRKPALILIAALTVIQTLGWARPMHLKPAQQQIQTAATWIRDNHLADRPIYATHAWFPYFMNFVENPRVHKGKRLLAAMPVGTLVLWDRIYSASDYHGVKLEDLRADREHYRQIWLFEAEQASDRLPPLVLFEKMAVTPVPPDPDRPYPPSTSGDLDEIYTSYYIVP